MAAPGDSDPDLNPFADRLPADVPDPTEDARDQSVFAEPWMRKQIFAGDATSDGPQPVVGDADAEHSVWDEPAITETLSGSVPDDAITWASWYRQRRAGVSWADTWLVTILLVVLSAPLALLTAWISLAGTAFGLVMFVVVIPATEEILKVLLPLWIVETRPYLFRSRLQILLCTIATGTLFGALRFWFGETALFVVGRPMQVRTGHLVLAVGMHAVCSLLMGLGLARIWRHTVREVRRPDLTRGSWYGTAAVSLHVVYAALQAAQQLFPI